jgi:hypothetical protein
VYILFCVILVHQKANWKIRMTSSSKHSENKVPVSRSHTIALTKNDSVSCHTSTYLSVVHNEDDSCSRVI